MRALWRACEDVLALVGFGVILGLGMDSWDGDEETAYGNGEFDDCEYYPDEGIEPMEGCDE